MELMVSIPDEVAQDLLTSETPLERRALELLAVDGYKRGKLTEYQVRIMLGFDYRFAVDAFLKEHGAYYDYTIEEHNEGVAALTTLLEREGRLPLKVES